MAISPEEADRKSKPSEELIEKMCKAIDAEIVKRSIEGGSVYIPTRLFGTGRVRTTLEAAYRAAGWTLYREALKTDDEEHYVLTPKSTEGDPRDTCGSFYDR